MVGTAPRDALGERTHAIRVVTVACTAVSVLAALSLLVLVGAETAAGAPTGCSPGVQQVNGGLARVVCGPARATVVLTKERR